MPALAILAIDALVHLYRFGQPLSVVFDEVYFGNFAAQYWARTYFFDLHPPLAKLITSFIGHLAGVERFVIDWKNIGDPLPFAADAMRIMPVLAGIALPVVIYYLCRRLRFSVQAALLAGLLVSLENSLIVQSRFILFDVVMLVCGFGGILLYIKSIHMSRTASIAPAAQDLWHSRMFTTLSRPMVLSIISALLIAAAVSIKWTSLAYLGIILLVEAYRQYSSSNVPVRERLKKFFTVFSIYIGSLLIIYVSSFAIHLGLLTKSGSGDAFMTPQFQATLEGNYNQRDPNIHPESFPTKFVELNLEMFNASRTLAAQHPYSSKWYTWPFMLRPIFYWQEVGSTSTPPESRTSEYIYLFGNPVIYWLGALAVLLLLGKALWVFVREGLQRTFSELDTIHVFIVVAFLANFLPFIFIGRVMFLYHYEPALVVSIMATAYLVDHLKGKWKRIATFSIVGVAALAFIFWSPLTYGTPLTDSQLHARMWISSWR